jgi:hypothetical protein
MVASVECTGATIFSAGDSAGGREVIDKLTPDGAIPEDSVLKQGLGLFAKHFLKG